MQPTQIIFNDSKFCNNDVVPNSQSIKDAKQWYFGFTGKQYNGDDVKELVEMHDIIKKLVDI